MCPLLLSWDDVARGPRRLRAVSLVFPTSKPLRFVNDLGSASLNISATAQTTLVKGGQPETILEAQETHYGLKSCRANYSSINHALRAEQTHFSFSEEVSFCKGTKDIELASTTHRGSNPSWVPSGPLDTVLINQSINQVFLCIPLKRYYT